MAVGLAACGGGGGGGGQLPGPASGSKTSADGGAAVPPDVVAGDSAGDGDGPAVSVPSYGGPTQPPITARPAPAPAPGGAGPAIAGSNVVGAWDSRILPWTDGSGAVLPLHAALLADGRVLSYGAHSARAGGGYEFNFDVWTPPAAGVRSGRQ